MRFPRATSSVAVAALTGGLLASCNLIVPDTGATDPDRFVQEISPVFYRPPGVDPMRVRPLRDQPVPQTRDLYKTQFHQTYGLPVVNPLNATLYGQIRDDGFTLPAVPISRVDPAYLRQEVDYRTAERPGTVVIDTRAKHLYLVLGNGRAMRYGVGLGRDGYAWSGRGTIQWKAKWPRWTPPAEMVARQPEVRAFAASQGGMNPGLLNPLGARALYIYKDGRDTLYRIHGTPDWQSVGKATSSGCVRMFNQDVIDLYDRLRDKAEIVVL